MMIERVDAIIGKRERVREEGGILTRSMNLVEREDQRSQ